MTARVKQIFIHPVKGLTPQAKESVVLTPGHGIKGDRAFALMFADCAPDYVTSTVPWKSKKNFAVQNDWPSLAALTCNYNPEKDELTVQRSGITLLVEKTQTPQGRERIGAFFTEYLATQQPTESARHPQRARLNLVGSASGETRYPDRESVHISLLSQATLDAIGEVCGKRVDVRRFRPNILLEGVAAWEEFTWVGQKFLLGSAKIAIAARINRCVNIEVNPDTGDRDLPLLSVLRQHFGHLQTGILATVETEATVTIGDTLTLLNPKD
ncbi:MAG: MOSC domain-containing protein [Oscillatoriaceae bacterium SKW80]|nr:MOSC domain-containing protein [Oscillatoriaceae bacterium SKYG93]MCX8121496.1 MOSC domain-containing protein [Oscillatoriaceae bacterium SKW80]MDW8452918.1 MOSC domain-containing protein [Oscillatoriaceae cyanobacterium SKYGB_i_bin93]HIK27841.1 MOSC domain-containing protein [Oscillatoriaceae cyanobacterium M7585_C2015_266]